MKDPLFQRLIAIELKKKFNFSALILIFYTMNQNNFNSDGWLQTLNFMLLILFILDDREKCTDTMVETYSCLFLCNYHHFVSFSPFFNFVFFFFVFAICFFFVRCIIFCGCTAQFNLICCYFYGRSIYRRSLFKRKCYGFARD